MSASSFGFITSRPDRMAGWLSSGSGYSAPISSRSFPYHGFTTRSGHAWWRTLRTAAIEYIALVFAADFILAPLQANALGKYPLSYLPFALLLIGGAGLRFATYVRQQLLQPAVAD